ncbi:MAG TPA: hypothetical protein VNT76_09355, partial [Candidatus Binatus sp.]|nr:hypothetical protein [Candidatus Binatus sp.]
ERGRSSMYLKGNKRFARSFEAALSYLEKIRLLCRARGIDFVVAMIPDEIQVNHDLEKAVREKFHADVDGSQWDISLPNRTLSSRLSQLGIDHIDLHDAFVAGSAHARLYKPRDTHWNIAGNRLAAGIIADHIQKYVK